MAWRGNNYGNRGKQLEDYITQANQKYSFQDRAVVQKLATPVKVLDINPQTGHIRSGYFEKKSTVDFMGEFKGQAICFDAKSTNAETRFDLSNVKDHQYRHMKNWHNNGGITFLVVWFKKQNEFYYLPFEVLHEYWENMKKNDGRKSIPYSRFESEWKIERDGMIIVDYLTTLERIEEV